MRIRDKIRITLTKGKKMFRITATVKTHYTVDTARGPNPDNMLLQVLDSDGDRMMYANSLAEARANVHDMVAESVQDSTATVIVSNREG
jgi:hypothetical protein